MKCIQIFKDGKMDELKIPSKNIIKFLTDSSKSQGNNELIKLYTWKFEGSIICCYGWYDGVTGFENSHDLPQGGMSDFIDEDSSEKILYGDIFILKYQGDKNINITVSDYSMFYSDYFDISSNYSSEEEEENDIIEDNNLQEDVDEIVSDKHSINELEYDNYEY
jgi:hypothetical protein